MPFRIKLAETSLELDALFQARHRAFVEEMRYQPPSPCGRLVDRFDAFSETANFVVLDDEDRVVGGVRGVEDSEVGMPPDVFFDFRPYLLARDVRACAGSMLFVHPEYRHLPGITFALLGLFYCWALARGATHIVGVAAPVAEPLFLDGGYRALSPRFLHAPTNLYAMPVMLDLARLDPRLARFVSRHRLPPAAQCFDRLFCAAGEVLSALPPGSPFVYLVLDGQLAVDAQGGEPTPGSPALEPGDVFGEVALLSSASRTARALGLTEVELARVDRRALPALHAQDSYRRPGLRDPDRELSPRGGAASL